RLDWGLPVANCSHAAASGGSSRRCRDLTAANEQSEGHALAEAGSAFLSPSLCHQVVDIGGPKTSSLRPRCARLRGDSHGGRNIGDAQVSNLASHQWSTLMRERSTVSRPSAGAIEAMSMACS